MLSEERALEVIELTRKALGRSWKRDVYFAWLQGNYPAAVRHLAPELQQLRNSDLRARKKCTPRSL